MAAEQVFAFRFEPLYRRLGRPFGVTPASARVDVGGGVLIARFGPWRVQTPIANVAGHQVTGPFSALKTVGPAHVSLADRGLTFATNSERGLCVRFHEPVAGIEPVGWLRHPGLTVTVADVDGLAAAIDAELGESRGER